MKRRHALTKVNEIFRKFAARASTSAGSPLAFCLAILIVIIWASFGPYYRWSSNHSLFINSLTTIVTFLMVFLVQASQNRDTKAVLLKLDELIRTSQASNKFIQIEAKEESIIKEIQAEIRQHLQE